MEERKLDQHLTKKVRFDLNEEVFLIPSKWDRLSKCKTTNARIMAGKHKNRTVADRRNDNKGKQNRNRKTQNGSTSGKLASNCEPNGMCSGDINGRPNSTPNIKTNNARKTAPRAKEGNDNANSRTSTSPVEGRLKLYHRPPPELPKLDLVLPKIPYTPDLKKAIEKALQRSRRKPSVDNGLNTTMITQDKKSEVLNSLPKEKTERIFQRRLSDSSIRIADEKPIENNQHQNGEGSSKFSELSSNIDGWSPFSAWNSKDSTLRSNSTAPLTRGRSMSSLIPNSILY